eukprot:5723686-Alexandrium_andersonii.AAC.1
MSASLVGSEMCIRDSSRLSLLSRLLHAACSSASGRQGGGVAGEGWALSLIHILTLPTICSV